MSRKKPGPERLGAFSDNMISIIITIMVLELKVPHQASLTAVAALWPVMMSYALSYLIVALIWIHHHNLLLYIRHADSPVLYTNLLLLFLVSLIPFSTEYMAETRMAPFSTAMYAANFVLVTVAFTLFEHRVGLQTDPDDFELQQVRRIANRRSWVVLVLYLADVPLAYVHPPLALGLILINALFFGVPDVYRLLLHRKAEPLAPPVE